MADMYAWQIAGAIVTSLGGGALIVAALFKWLGELTAKRILQREQGDVLKGIEELKQELSLLKSNYEKNAEWVTEFYSMFYRHYQLAHRAARADIIQHPDRPDEDTKKRYLDELDDQAAEWNRAQALARILLPSNLLALHEAAIDKFNEFKDAVKAFDRADQNTRAKVENCFSDLHSLKGKLENGVREYLRSEALAK